MRPLVILLAIGWGNFFLAGGTALAQERTFGRPLQRQPGPARLPDVAAVAETAGGITGAERFLRESRQPGEFVGADQASTRFVGSGAVIETGRVRSAVESLTRNVDLAGQINRPLAPAGANQPYSPLLQLEFSPSSQSADGDSAAPPWMGSEGFERRLDNLLQRTGAQSLSAKVVGQTVYLHGTATHQRHRQLAELLVSFEPGVRRVVNDILVAE